MKNVKQIFIFIGPPGAGKGSLSQLCVSRLGWAQLSTGDLCRQHIAAQTEIGKQIDFFIRSGKLIPDSLMIEMVEAWLLEKFKNIDVLILDGFPRTIVQAEALNALLSKEAFAHVTFHVVQLVLDDAEVKHRLLGRLICPNKECGAVYSKEDAALQPRKEGFCDVCPNMRLIVRSDDTPESIQHRLEVYHKHANALLHYYKQHGDRQVKTLDASKPLSEVFDHFVQMISVTPNTVKLVA
jgi:adenylate kinase